MSKVRIKKMLLKYGLFDADWYVRAYPDVAKSGVNPLVHYLLYGMKEGRKAKPPSNASTKKQVVGAVDNITSAVVSGWAMNTVDSTKSVVLDLFIDGVLYTTSKTVSYRKDIVLTHGGAGYYGFILDLPQNLDNSEQVTIEVRARLAYDIKQSSIPLLPKPNASRMNQVPDEGIYLGKVVPEYMDDLAATGAKKIAVIVLNLNGKALLEAFFRTLVEEISYTNIEYLIVDHNSEDGSQNLVLEYGNKAPITLLAREKNYSFSESNNWAARQTDAEILIFINNDVEFCQDIFPEISRILSSPYIGAVGIKLLDKNPLKHCVATESIQHLGVFYRSDARERFVMPFESRAVGQFQFYLNKSIEVPTVTGAFLAMRTKDFMDLGGFEKDYFYGYEDVDLCLKIKRYTSKKILCVNYLTAIHLHGETRKDPDVDISPWLIANRALIDKRMGAWLRRRMSEDHFELPGHWTSMLPKIAFAVTDARDEAEAGDYFTALELGREIQKNIPCHIIFLDKKKGDWLDASSLDVIIAMRDDYDIRKLKNQTPRLLKIAWVRNWTDRWAQREWAREYNRYWASSGTSTEYLVSQLSRPVTTLPIATNYQSLSAGKEDRTLLSDYCFTGSYWGAPRDIAEMLDPAALEYDFALFGYGWEDHPVLKTYSRGGLPYSKMKDIYANTKIVIDDANSATKQWGSVNSRVFDALAAGALVITNGTIGAIEMFNGLLPTYNTKQELEHLLYKYLSNDELRKNLVLQLNNIISEGHTYYHRAEIACKDIKFIAKNQLRFAIKIGAPNTEICHEWGDYHFALAIQKELVKKGHFVRIDCLDAWETPEGIGDDAILVLRGLSEYTPKDHQINIMWNISHPDKVATIEYNEFDHVFVASSHYADQLKDELDVPVDALLQCTDASAFNPSVKLSVEHEFLFVGNSRNVYRRSVKNAVEAGLPVAVYGSRWKQFISPEFLKGEHIPNEKLASYYAGAKLVLNDHWDTMRQYGFISNRLFDAAATGALILSDHVEGINDIFGDSVITYSSASEFNQIVGTAAALSEDGQQGENKEQRIALAKKILSEHSFTNRVDCILGVVNDLLGKMLMQRV